MDLASAWPEFASWMWSKKVNDSVNFTKLADNSSFPQVKELFTISIINAIVLSVSRFLLERYALGPFFEALLGTNSAKRSVPFKCLELEKIYSERRLSLPDINEVKALSTKLGRNVEDINKWFKHRQVIDREAIKIKRCTECLWRLITYSSCFAYGFTLAKKQPWFFDTKACWTGIFEEGSGDADLKMYYVGVQIPLYAHLLLKSLNERRSAGDRWEMLAHHALAVVLLVFSYLGNFLRLGTIAMLYLDVTDLFLESSKLLSYLKWGSLSNLLLFGLSIIWAYSRLFKFASVIIYSTAVESVEVDVIGPSYYGFVGFLCVLLALNLYWFHAISSIAYRIMWGGGYAQARDRANTDLSTDDGGSESEDY